MKMVGLFEMSTLYCFIPSFYRQFYSMMSELTAAWHNTCSAERCDETGGFLERYAWGT